MRFSPGFIGSANGGNDAFTKSLLHFDGANNGTVFTDSNFGGSAKTWTPQSAYTATTGFVKFGTAAGVMFSITTPASSDWVIGSNDFTIDFWLVTGIPGGAARTLMGQGDATGLGTSFTWYINTDTSSRVFVTVYNSAGTAYQILTTTAHTGSTWRHVAVVKSGTLLTAYINGVPEGTPVNIVGPVRTNLIDPIGIGRIGAGSPAATGFLIDEFRFSNGIARAINAPPTAAYF